MSGHGVGLSGTGALARAGRGNSYSTILGYYYTGTAISPVNTARNIRIAISYVSPDIFPPVFPEAQGSPVSLQDMFGLPPAIYDKI